MNVVTTSAHGLVGSRRKHHLVTVRKRSHFGLKRNATWLFFCECIRVKPLCKSIIMTKVALLRFTIFSFSGQTHFQWECYGHFYDSIAIFKTLRRLDTTWNFARSITRVSTHEREHWEHCLCTKRRVFEQLTLAVSCSASHHPASREVWIRVRRNLPPDMSYKCDRIFGLQEALADSI